MPSLNSSIQDDKSKIPNPIIDFNSATIKRRLQQLNKKQLFCKAVGLNPAHKNPIAVDATAGLGTDSFLLAALGYQVLAIERQAEIASMLQVALVKVQQSDSDHSVLAKRISVLHADARTILNDSKNLDPAIHLIYLDPMFTARRKSALNRLALRTLAAITGKDDDADELLHISLKASNALPSCKRVIVKRRRLAPQLSSRIAPNHQLYGRSIRYDIYMRGAILS